MKSLTGSFKFVCALLFIAYGKADVKPIEALSNDPTRAFAPAQVRPSTQAASVSTVLVPACDTRCVALVPSQPQALISTFSLFSGLKDIKVPQFGVDWPSEGEYDNQRGRCAFGGAFPHPIVDSLIKQCKSKSPSTAKRNTPTACSVSNGVDKMSKHTAAHAAKIATHTDAYLDEYVRNCQTDKGMWGGGYTPSMECIISYFGRNFNPGFAPPPRRPSRSLKALMSALVRDHIFDFGTGCGHQAAWLKVSSPDGQCMVRQCEIPLTFTTRGLFWYRDVWH